MILKPQSVSELSTALASAGAKNEKVSSVDLSTLARLLEHKAEDMTATVKAGMTLTAFQNEIQKRGQWLPIDPPNPEKLTIADLLSKNESGPRRFGYGTIRDYLIGLKVVLADGRLISSGGKVVKNVAGYDVMKLFIGGHGSLGVIVEATFKLRPLPETEKFVAKKYKSLGEATATIEAVLDSELTPVVFDLHSSAFVLGFAGTKEEVEWQLAKAAELGFNEPSSLDYEKHFWAIQKTLQKTSVLPSKIIETIRSLNNESFIARAGNGIIYYASELKGPLPAAVNPKESARGVPSAQLAQRLKNEFDPKNILPEMPL